MEIAVAGLAGMIAVAVKVMDFAKLVANLPDRASAVVTQLAVWIGATAVVFLYGASQLGDFVIPGTELALTDANVWAKVALGISLGSAASVLVDIKQALDSTDSAEKPPLIKR